MAGGIGLSNMDTLRKQWTVEIPLPPRSVSPNRKSSEHWSKRHRAVKEYREACYWIYMAARPTLARIRGFINMPVVIHADFYMAPCPYDGCVRPRDHDNAQGCLKPAIDALVDAGVLQGDSAKHVRTGAIRLHSKAKDHKGRHCVLLTIEAAE